MWRLNDPTAMAAPSLYPSLLTVQRKICQLPLSSSAPSDFSGSVLTQNPPSPPSKSGVSTGSPAPVSSSRNDGLQVVSVTILNFFFYSFPIGFRLAAFVTTDVFYAVWANGEC